MDVWCAKLSRKFYERLGDDIASELVDWFNAVDLTYQTQLRELNDLSWERFKSHLDAGLAALRAELPGEFRSGLAELRTELHAELASGQNESSSGLAQLRTEMGAELSKIQASQNKLLRWMLIYSSGLFVGLVGLIVGIGTFLYRH